MTGGLGRAVSVGCGGGFVAASEGRGSTPSARSSLDGAGAAFAGGAGGVVALVTFFDSVTGFSVGAFDAIRGDGDFTGALGTS